MIRGMELPKENVKDTFSVRGLGGAGKVSGCGRERVVLMVGAGIKSEGMLSGWL